MPAPLQGKIAEALQHHHAGRLPQAEQLYRQILSQNPNDAEALAMLGALIHQKGDDEGAIALMLRAVAVNPNHLAAQQNLSFLRIRRGELGLAIEHLRRVTELRPDAESFSDLGIILARVDVRLAADALKKALTFDAGHVASLSNLGLIYATRGHLSQALALHRRAVNLLPTAAVVQLNLGHALLANGEIDAAIEAFGRAIAIDPLQTTADHSLLLALQYHPRRSSAEVFDAHRNWAQRFADPLAARTPIFTGESSSHRPLRVGYLSPDFCEHAVAFFIEPVITNHRHHVVEPYCYHLAFESDAYTARIRAAAAGWRDVSAMGDEQLVETMRADKLDILVDLSGHTSKNRLRAAARRAAPIQVNWIGYPGSTGMKAIDYWITDALCDPPGQTEAFATEKLLRMPRTFTCYRPPDDASLVSPLPVKSRGGVTFGSFNQLVKLNDDVVSIWAAVMREVAQSRLLVMDMSMHDAAAQNALAARFAVHGIVRERLDMRPWQSITEYLKAHAEVDLLLDTFPFTGHTTTLHALWMGCPIVTLAGDRHVARRGVSVLTNLQLPELIAQTHTEFVAIAIALANDLDRLESLRSTMRDRMKASPLMQYAQFVEDLEGMYEGIVSAAADAARRGSAQC